MPDDEKKDTEISPEAKTEAASPQAIKTAPETKPEVANPPSDSSPDLNVTEDDSLLTGGESGPDETQPSPSQKARDACPACAALNGKRPCSAECYERAGYDRAKYDDAFGPLSPEDQATVDAAKAPASPDAGHPPTRPSGHPHVPGNEPWSKVSA